MKKVCFGQNSVYKFRKEITKQNNEKFFNKS